MEGLLSVSLGTVFWASISFLIVLILLKKMAWKPILQALKDREESIENALSEAEKARSEMANLQSDNEKFLKDARIERDHILKEGREMRDSMVADAKGKAKEEADKMIESAREAIENEKNAAIADMKTQVASLSLDIAEKVIRQKLSDESQQQQLVESMLNDVKLN
ncbi:MAG: F-type H+-transporting ATPase subunit b [Flavobacteriales bacterium]|jgi:F-type H+-transporting ATPase subunit b